MEYSEAEGVLAFLQKAENLKNTLRSSYTSNGRRESAAEHSWRLCLLITACSTFFQDLNMEKLLKLAVIHDLAEAICGDTPAIHQSDPAAKSAEERAALQRIVQPLPEHIGHEITALWEEYDSGATEEARLVKALDKLETLIQHNQGTNPPDFNYAFNLHYGKVCTDEIPALSCLRHLVDAETKRHVARMLSGNS